MKYDTKLGVERSEIRPLQGQSFKKVIVSLPLILIDTPIYSIFWVSSPATICTNVAIAAIFFVQTKARLYNLLELRYNFAPGYKTSPLRMHVAQTL